MAALTRLPGFDLSHYQHSVNMQVAWNAGFRFCYDKVLEGTSYPDGYYVQNRKNALAVGMTFGGYYWAHPNLDPIQCADLFIAKLNQIPGMLQPILDIEHNGNPTSNPTGPGGRSPAQIHSWIHTFRHRVQAHGYRLDTYTGAWFWDGFVLPGIPGGKCSECANSRLYLSRYAAAIGAIPPPWDHASVWQFTETGSVPGVETQPTDRDILVGTEVLSDLVYKVKAPPPPSEGDDSMSAQDVANLKTYIDLKFAAINANVDHAVDEIRTQTGEGNSIANVRAHQDTNAAVLSGVKGEVDSIRADLNDVKADTAAVKAVVLHQN